MNPASSLPYPVNVASDLIGLFEAIVGQHSFDYDAISPEWRKTFSPQFERVLNLNRHVVVATVLMHKAAVAELMRYNHPIKKVKKQKKGTNRNQTEPRIQRYRRDIEAGEWLISNSMITFGPGPDGKVIMTNGQHTLEAYLRADVTDPLLAVVAFNLPAESRLVMDTHKPRGANDNVFFATDEPVSKQMITALRAFVCPSTGGEAGSMSPSAIADMIKKYRAGYDFVNNLWPHSDKDIKLHSLLAVWLRAYFLCPTKRDRLARMIGLAAGDTTLLPYNDGDSCLQHLQTAMVQVLRETKTTFATRTRNYLLFEGIVSGYLNGRSESDEHETKKKPLRKKSLFPRFDRVEETLWVTVPRNTKKKPVEVNIDVDNLAAA